jgi:hypothetical protein
MGDARTDKAPAMTRRSSRYRFQNAKGPAFLAGLCIELPWTFVESMVARSARYSYTVSQTISVLSSVALSCTLFCTRLPA